MELFMFRNMYFFFDMATGIIPQFLPPAEIRCQKEIVVLNREDCHRADANIRKDRFS